MESYNESSVFKLHLRRSCAVGMPYFSQSGKHTATPEPCAQPIADCRAQNCVVVAARDAVVSEWPVAVCEPPAVAPKSNVAW